MRIIVIRSIRQMVLWGLVAAGIGLGVNLIHPYGIDYIAPPPPPAVEDASIPGADTLSIQTAQEFHEREIGLFVDARRERRFAAGTIPGAINLPWSHFQRYYNDTIMTLLSRPSIIVYGEDANDINAAELARKLVEDGYIEVYFLPGGLKAWKDRGLGIEQRR